MGISGKGRKTKESIRALKEYVLRGTEAAAKVLGKDRGSYTGNVDEGDHDGAGGAQYDESGKGEGAYKRSTGLTKKNLVGIGRTKKRADVADAGDVEAIKGQVYQKLESLKGLDLSEMQKHVIPIEFYNGGYKNAGEIGRVYKMYGISDLMEKLPEEDQIECEQRLEESIRGVNQSWADGMMKMMRKGAPHEEYNGLPVEKVITELERISPENPLRGSDQKLVKLKDKFMTYLDEEKRRVISDEIDVKAEELAKRAAKKNNSYIENRVQKAVATAIGQNDGKMAREALEEYKSEMNEIVSGIKKDASARVDEELAERLKDMATETARKADEAAKRYESRLDEIMHRIEEDASARFGKEVDDQVKDIAEGAMKGYRKEMDEALAAYKLDLHNTVEETIAQGPARAGEGDGGGAGVKPGDVAKMVRDEVVKIDGERLAEQERRRNNKMWS